MDPSISEYLERLNARLDAYTNATRSLAEKLNALDVSWATSSPAVVHNPPSATTSPESTTNASAPVPDVSGSITKAQEIPTVAHDAASVCITMVPVTCSTECSTQIDTIDSVDEVHDAATAVHLEPTVDPTHQEVEQLAPVQATASIGTNTPSSAEVVTPVSTTTDIDPKASVQEFDALSVDTSTQVTSKADHDVTLIIPSDPAPPVLTMCSTDCLVQDGDWVQPVHLVHKSKTWFLPPVRKGIKQPPWPPPIRVQIAMDDDIQVLGLVANDDTGYVWWPPDYQPRVWSKVQKWLLPVPRCLRDFAACSATGPASGIASLESTDCANCLVMIFLDKGIADSQVLLKYNLALHAWSFDSLCNTTTSLPAYKTLQWFVNSFHFPGCIGISAFHSPIVVWCSDSRSLGDHRASAAIPSLADYLNGGNLASHIISDAVIAYFNHGHRHAFIQWPMFAYLGILEFDHGILHIIDSLICWSGRRTSMGRATNGNYTQSAKLFCFPLPMVKLPENHDWYIIKLLEIQQRILIRLYIMDCTPCTEALEKYGCQYLISTKASNLLQDKRCLNCHMVRREIDSKMLQQSDAGAKRMELSIQSVGLCSSGQFLLSISWPLSFQRNTSTGRPCCTHTFQLHLRGKQLWSSNEIRGWTFNLSGDVKTSIIQHHVACNRICLQLHQFGVLAMHLIDGIPFCLYQYTATGDFAYKSWQRQYNFSGHFGGILTDQFFHLWSLKHVKFTVVSEQHHSCLATVVVHLFVLVLQDLNAAQSVVRITRLLPNMFCCIIILGSGDISWCLHQMILSTLKHSVKSTQAKLPNTYTYSVFNLQPSTFWTVTACHSSMLSIISEPLLHIHSVVLLLPWPPPEGRGLQSTDFFTRGVSCLFGTLVLSCLLPEQISCEANHSCWYLALLKMLAVQTVQNAAEACDSESSMSASVVLLFGHKKSMSKDLHFLHLKGGSSSLLLVVSNTASIVGAIHWNKSCEEFSPDNQNQDGLAREPWFKLELAAIASIYGYGGALLH